MEWYPHTGAPSKDRLIKLGLSDIAAKGWVESSKVNLITYSLKEHPKNAYLKNWWELGSRYLDGRV